MQIDNFIGLVPQGFRLPGEAAPIERCMEVNDPNTFAANDAAVAAHSIMRAREIPPSSRREEWCVGASSLWTAPG